MAKVELNPNNSQVDKKHIYDIINWWLSRSICRAIVQRTRVSFYFRSKYVFKLPLFRAGRWFERNREKEKRKLGVKMDTEGEKKGERVRYRSGRVCTRMCTENKKLQIIRDYKPTTLDGDALVKLEEDNEDLSSDLKHLYFNFTDEFPLPAVDRKALVILYPHRHRDRFHKIQVKLVTELEKEFSGYAVFLVARLTCYRRNLVDIEDVFMEDVVYPAKILGKYVAGKDVKYYLDPKNESKDKWEEFQTVFKKYAQKQISFEYIKELQRPKILGKI
ncbi:hypothetical protein LXL04_015959 [Taraxacum kok-saghyz]